MGMTNPNPTDRRVQRTRRTLREALVALILERGWEETSVQDVCDRADVGRSTFYTHFADKEELLLSGFDNLRKELRAHAVAAGPGRRVLGFARVLIEHAQDNLRLFRALIGKRSGQAVQKHFRQVVIDLVRADLAGAVPQGPRLEAAVHYLAGAFVEVVIWWLDTRTGLQPADLEQLVQQLTTPVVSALRGQS